MSEDIVQIDGSFGESGGQILRTALTLSSITQKPFRIFNIRAKRSNPGLRPQHLTAAKAVRSICRGTLEGAEIGSRELVFRPGKIVGGKYEFNISTAGSTVLVAQTILPILFSAKKKSSITIIGGTHVLKSPGWDYFSEVFIPAIRLFGAKIKGELIESGYYPKGGGRIRIETEPSKFKGMEKWPGKEKTKGIIRVSRLPVSIAMREKKVLLNSNITDVRIIEEEALSPGNAVTLWNGLRGSYVPGKRGKRAEKVAQEAVEELERENGDVDRHLADQLCVYAFIAKGKTAFTASEKTNHFETNVETIKKFIDREIKTDENKIMIL